MRIALAKLLLARPNLLLMDEPTNHLDLPARNWLEEYLADYPGSVVLVSHDRYFLDATVKRITEVGLKTLTDYHGNYSHYVVEHAARMERLREAHRRQSEEIEKAEVFINRFRYTATKAKQVQSRIKQLDKVERIEIPPERKKIRFKFPEAPRPGRVVLELKGVRKAYGDERRPRPPGPDGRARGPDRPRRPERRRQVDADAHPRRGRPRRRGRAPPGPQGGPRLLRPGPGRRPQPLADRPRGDVLGQLRLHGPDDPHDPRRVPVRGGRRLQEGRGPLRGRAQPPRPREDAPQRRRTSSSSTSPRTTSTSTRRRSCSTPSRTTAGRSSSSPTTATSWTSSPPRSSRWAAARPPSTPAGTRTSCTGRRSASRPRAVASPGATARGPGRRDRLGRDDGGPPAGPSPKAPPKAASLPDASRPEGPGRQARLAEAGEGPGSPPPPHRLRTPSPRACARPAPRPSARCSSAS